MAAEAASEAGVHPVVTTDMSEKSHEDLSQVMKNKALLETSPLKVVAIFAWGFNK